MQSLGFCPTRQGEGKDWRFCGIWALNRAEWAITLMACMHIGTTGVGFYDAMGVDQVEFILNQTEMSTIFCTVPYAKKTLTMKQSGKASGIENLVLMDCDTVDAELN